MQDLFCPRKLQRKLQWANQVKLSRIILLWSVNLVAEKEVLRFDLVSNRTNTNINRQITNIVSTVLSMSPRVVQYRCHNLFITRMLNAGIDKNMSIMFHSRPCASVYARPLPRSSHGRATVEPHSHGKKTSCGWKWDNDPLRSSQSITWPGVSTSLTIISLSIMALSTSRKSFCAVVFGGSLPLVL